MNKNFEINYRHSSGNLHIDVLGEFDGQCAWELVKTVQQNSKGCGRIFVQTDNLNKLSPNGVHLFKQLLSPKVIPLKNFYFKGQKGFEIGPDGTRVLICNKTCHNKHQIPSFASQQRKLKLIAQKKSSK